ncbi:MAG: hypothetical protein FJ213_09095 [Ignavibacteria bacterium]|nr:hypothetical protein [Ignavibacteria bacterium]
MTSIKFKTKLKSNIIKIENPGNLLGKDVEVCVTEIQTDKLNKKEWTVLGALSLKGILDNKNIRDAAYE